jgi:hypothetical protein
MQETLELRLDDKYARRIFRDDEGTCPRDIGVRVVRLPTHDPRLSQLRELNRRIRRKEGSGILYSFRYIRQYTQSEIATAEAFALHIERVFEPAGDECGTEYDESTACPQCGAAATQMSDLRLDLRKTPKKKDIARTLAREIVVSQRLAELLLEAAEGDVHFRPVRHKARYEDDSIDCRRLPSGRRLMRAARREGVSYDSGSFHVWINRAENRYLWDEVKKEYAALRGLKERLKPLVFPIWHQPVIANTVRIVPPTRLGTDPLDDDERGEFRCPAGDTIGLYLLSELSVSRQDFNCHELSCTRQFVGMRQGLFRPEQLLLASQRLWQRLRECDVTGLRAEVAHLR